VPDVGHGQADVLGEGTVSTDAQTDAVGAEVPAPGEADVAPDATLVITFSEPVRPTTVSVAVRDRETGAWEELLRTWSPDGLPLQVAPLTPLRELAAPTLRESAAGSPIRGPGH